MPETTRISTLNPRTTTTKATLYSTPDTYTITSPPSSPAINTDITVASTATSSSTIATVSSMETTKGTSPVVVTSQSSPDITYSTTQSSTSIRPETFTTSRISSSITQTSSEAATSPSTTVPSTPISSTAWMTTTPCRGEYKFNGDIAMAFELTTNTDKQDVETLVKTLLTYTKNPYSFVPDVVTGVAPSGYILAPYPDTTHYNPPSNYDVLSNKKESSDSGGKPGTVAPGRTGLQESCRLQKRKRTRMAICTYNARTLASEAAIEDLMMQAKKTKYDVIGLTDDETTSPSQRRI
ncbi:hypothetical protein NECAME_12408 [Necator americanus]|uniref:Uncharacterized protein n=1 Tax=Necator americanus TaxID=51031 RepID=W2T370_NECAM|nr:hypothetical protein NECAME_12408 [Necator americanus]ETN75422.1 hypothetical protein NECAME_12408 [Necator americanus]